MTVGLTVEQLEREAQRLVDNEPGVYGVDVESGVTAVAYALLATSARLDGVERALSDIAVSLDAIARR